MSNLRIFNYGGNDVRTILIDGEPYFVGKDVAGILGYAKARNAISAHVDNEDKKDAPIQGNPGGKQKMTVINESGVYSLIFSSKLPTAKKFKRWVTNEVLPSIRKHGAYITASTAEKMMNDPDFMIRVFTELKHEKEQRSHLEKENAALLPDANMARDIIKYNGLYSLKEVADLVEKGRTELCALLRVSNVLSKQTGYNLPLRKYTKQDYFKIKINNKFNTPVTLVTAKGLRFIYRLIKKYDLTDEFDMNTLLKAAEDIETETA